MAQFKTGAEVSLRHNGSTKLATTATGIDVTGAITVGGAALGSGGMEFIASSGAISNAASASFTQFDATKYDHYQFMFQHVIPATDAQDLLAHASTNGGSSYDTTNGNYHNNGATDRAGFMVAGLVGSDTNEYGISGEFKLLAPHNTGYTYASTFAPLMKDATNINMGDTGETGTSNNIFATVHMVAADVDAIQFKFTSGNIE